MPAGQETDSPLRPGRPCTARRTTQRPTPDLLAGGRLVAVDHAALTHFLLAHGTDWQALHGFGDNASGTLSWASLNEPVPGGDWVGCAQALVAHGMPTARPDPVGTGEGAMLLGGRRSRFSDEVADYLLGLPATAQPD